MERKYKIVQEEGLLFLIVYDITNKKLEVRKIYKFDDTYDGNARLYRLFRRLKGIETNILRDHRFF